MWYESIVDKKVSFPDDVDQLPDIIIYFADDNQESRRHSFCRLKYSIQHGPGTDCVGPRNILIVPLKRPSHSW
jgi:hypothetical protein